jgi:hypothetical protein
MMMPSRGNPGRRPNAVSPETVPIAGTLALAVLLALHGATPARLAAADKSPSNGAARTRAKPDGLTGSDGSRAIRRKRLTTADGIETYSSKNFIVSTDIPAAEADELLERLETMLGLISKYWGRPLSGTIEMYVIREPRQWPAGSLPPEARDSIEAGKGVTITHTTVRGEAFHAKSVVYATADHGSPQHEAVHAYCGQTFGWPGPVWYSEGMAEMGRYWRPDDATVNADESVIRYLRSTEIKSVDDIVNGAEWSGDSWQNYAWRWALCHLLSHNTNYAQRFRPFGLGLLTRQGVNFNRTYGGMAKEIVFEYREFINHLDLGLRADLCSWDWKARFKPAKSSAITTCKVDAGRGWQASRLTLAKGEEYEFAADGTWTTAKNGAPANAEGNAEGAGRLVGAILRDEKGEYTLTEPFELGRAGTFVAPADGNLYLRCRDHWVSLADNSGTVTVRLKLRNKGNPLSPPKDERDQNRTGPRDKPGK